MRPITKDILWILFWIALAIFPWVYQPFIDLFGKYTIVYLWMIRVVLIILFLVKIGTIHEAIAEECGVKFKLIKGDSEWSSIEAKVFRPIFCMIIWGWKPIEENLHTYEAQNIFGAKWESCYTTDKTYRNEEKARKAIEKYKENSKRVLEEYVSRKKKKQKTVIKL